MQRGIVVSSYGSPSAPPPHVVPGSPLFPSTSEGILGCFFGGGGIAHVQNFHRIKMPVCLMSINFSNFHIGIHTVPLYSDFCVLPEITKSYM